MRFLVGFVFSFNVKQFIWLMLPSCDYTICKCQCSLARAKSRNNKSTQHTTTNEHF